MIHVARSMVTVLAAIFLSLLFAEGAHAAGFTLTYSGPNVSGTIFLVATPNGDGTFTVISATGSQTLGGQTLAVSGVIPLVDGSLSRYYYPGDNHYSNYENQLAPGALPVFPGANNTNGLLITFAGNPLPIDVYYDSTGYYGSGIGYEEAVYVGSDGNNAPDSAFEVYTITSLTLQQPSVAFLDPVPSLFTPTTSSITSDLNTLATGGKTVSGVAADGVTQLLIRVDGLTQGQQVNVSIVDETNSVPATGEDGTLSTPQGGTTAGPAYVSPAPQFASAINGYDGFVLYQSPIDFVRASALGAGDSGVGSHQVTIQVTDTNNNLLASSPLVILRAPVLFVHGLWGDPGTWTQFDSFLKTNITGITTYRADFEVTNGYSVAYNTPIVLAQAADFLQAFRSANGAAASQFDFIVHSMGGLISNSMPSNPAFDTPYDYDKGYIHKLITVDTPFQGSPLAKYTGASSASCKQKLKDEGAVVGGAIEDLTPGSAFLQNFKIPPNLYYKHAIASYLSPGETLSAEIAVDGLVSGILTGSKTPIVGPIIQKFQPVDVCYSIFVTANTSPPAFSFPTYFLSSFDPYSGASDLIVSEQSELGPFNLGTTAHQTSGLAHSHAAATLFGFTLTALPGSLDSGSGTPTPNPALALALLNASVSSTGSNSFAH
jgi:pimeloyl-ACP methyl ester carboxylesterase